MSINTPDDRIPSFSPAHAGEPAPAADTLSRREALSALGVSGLVGAGALGMGTAAAGASASARPPSSPVRPGEPRPPVPPGPLTAEQLGWDAAKRQFVLPPLPYAPNALEPHIDAKTMEVHHGAHHAAYVRGINNALQKLADIREGQGDASIIKHWQREVAFHGSGHVNHCLFWLVMAPPNGSGPAGRGGGEPTGELADALTRDFGSFEKFTTHFKAAALQVEGSGWGWLAYLPAADKLIVLAGESQQNMSILGAQPLLGVDCWEHAYYLKHQSKRKDYIDAFMNVINWARVSQFYRRARTGQG